MLCIAQSAVDAAAAKAQHDTQLAKAHTDASDMKAAFDKVRVTHWVSLD